MAQVCDLATLTAGGAPFRALSHHEQCAVMGMLKAKTLHFQDAGVPEDLETVSENSACFVCCPENQKHAIHTYLAYQDAVAVGAIGAGVDVQALIDEAKLWAKKSPQELAAMELYLDCQEVDIGGIAQ